MYNSTVYIIYTKGFKEIKNNSDSVVNVNLLAMCGVHYAFVNVRMSGSLDW